MLKLSHSTLIYIAGSLWVLMGIILFSMGIRFIFSALNDSSIEQPLASALTGIVGHPLFSSLIIFVFAIGLGVLKGQFLLHKAANRVITRIRTLPEPTPLQNVYDKRFYILILIMMLLGMSLSIFKVPSDIRGLVDVVVGIALLRGSLTYFSGHKVTRPSQP